MVRTVDGSEPVSGSLEGGTVGQVPYQSAPNTTLFVGPGTSGQVLTSNGATAPSYQNPTVAQSPTYRIFTSGSGTYVPTVGVSYLIVEMCGGGGGGAKNTSTYAPGSGSGAGFIKVRFPVGTYAYAVGAGGAGATTSGNDGAPGGNTTFGTLQASRGLGGFAATNSEPVAGGGFVTTGALQVLQSIQGGAGFVGAGLTVSPGAASFWSPPSYGASWGILATVPTSFGHGGGGGGVNSNNFSGSAGSGSGGRIVVTEYY